MEIKKNNRVLTKTPLPRKIIVKEILRRLPKRQYSPLFVFHHRTIAVTGTLSSLTRSRFELMLMTARKTRFRKSVSKGTHYLLTGDPGRFKNSNKKKAAKVKGVPKITEHQFWTYI